MKQIFKIGAFFLIVISTIVLRLFVIAIYRIPTPSMVPTIIPGDRILVNKSIYGPRTIKVRQLLFKKKQEFRWHHGRNSIKKGDIFVFNLPKYKRLNDKNPVLYGEPAVKRCYGMPGDTIKIKMNSIRKVDYKNMPHLFPRDSTLKWKVDNYGPLWVPAKGSEIKLTEKNILFYKLMIQYEGNKIVCKNDSVYINGILKHEYTFKYNYYFMLGDNFYGSQDSRFWGFVPETHIIGKVTCILFSVNPDDKWFEKFRWNRILKRF